VGSLLAARSVVLISFVNQEGQTAICSGVLVQPRIVVTAAHCTVGDMASMSVRFGAQANMADADHVRSVVAIKRPDHWDESKAIETPRYFYDIALLKLSADAPAGSYEMQLVDKNVDHSGIKEVMIAGFGAAASDGGAGTADVDYHLKEAKVRVIGFDDSGMQLDSSSGAGACLGDSGGPAFAPNGRNFVLIGTLVDVGEESGPNVCIFAANYTDTTYWVDWVEGNSFTLMQNLL